MDRPRYMNVPSPDPCHVNVAGVGKQSVWGLCIIARTQLLLWHESVNQSIAESGGNGVTLRYMSNQAASSVQSGFEGC